MRKSVLFLSTGLLGFLIPLSCHATDMSTKSSFSDAQRTEIEAILKDYLINKHPELLAEGLQNLQRREVEIADAQTKSKIAAEKERVFNDKTSPVSGNPKGKVAIVEFFDYVCGFCKGSEDGIEKILKDNKDVKVIYKHFPILGPIADEAAKASLASVKQGKFEKFHAALMKEKKRITSELIYEIAEKTGLNVKKLKKDMADEAIATALKNSRSLGLELGVKGTPFFIVNDETFHGILSPDQLQKAVEDARAKLKNK